LKWLHVMAKLSEELPQVRGEGGVGSAVVVQQPGVGPFQGLDAGDAVELGELLAFVSDWLASDPNRLDASLYEFVGVPDYVGPVCTAEELRAEVRPFRSYAAGLRGNRRTTLTSCGCQ